MNIRQMERFNYINKEFDRLMHEHTVNRYEMEIVRKRLNALEAGLQMALERIEELGKKRGRPKKDAH